MDEMVTVTWKQYDREVKISAPAVTIDAVVEDLIKPLLLAAGFHPNTIKEYFDSEE